MDHEFLVTTAINGAVLFISVLAYIFLFRNNLRLSPGLTFVIVYLTMMVSEAAYLRYDSVPIQSVVFVVQFFSGIWPIRTNIINGVTIAACCQSITSLLANLVMGVMLFVASLQKGGEWLSISEDSFETIVPRILGIIGAYMIMLKLRDGAYEMQGKVKWSVFVLVVVVYFLLTLFRNALGDGHVYHSLPGGIMLMIDIVSILAFLIGFLIMLIHIIRKRIAENRLIEKEISASYERYSAIEDIRQEYRQVRHDLKNVEKMKKRSE